jgi:hypothetical protein
MMLPPGHPRVGASTNSPAPAPARDRSQVTEQDRAWWAFQPLRTNSLPTGKHASTRSARSARTPVDRFILARLAEKGLGLNPAADRRTLLRRASFDLVGLPPTPAEVEEFTRDASPEAWARQVARLLNSPRHGERWARHWLDVARFAESSGFEHDYDRPHAYHYRDFVIRALNDDMPYDQFVRWQIAGDEFAPDDSLALMATGFLGAGVFPTQITANEVERTRYDAMDDMLATTGTAMLGLTVGCARCHDHKFDPIPTRDYYRMLATFTSTVRSDVELDLQPAENRRAREAFESEHAPLVAALAAEEAGPLPKRFDAWLAQGAPQPTPPAWTLLDPDSMNSKAGATFRKLPDGSLLAEGKNGDTDRYRFVAPLPVGAWRALRLEALADPSMAKGGPGRAENGNFGLSRLRARLITRAEPTEWATNEIAIARARATFEQNTQHLSIAASLDQNPQSGWAVDPRFGTNHAAIFEFAQPVKPGSDQPARLEVVLEFEVNTRHNLGRVRLAVTGSEVPTLDGDAVPAEIAGLLARLHGIPSVKAADALSPAPKTLDLPPAERATLLGWWKRSDSAWRLLQARVEAHAKLAPRPKLTKVMICGEGYPALRMHTQGADFFPETYFLQRGSTEQKRGVVMPGFLQVLGVNPDLEKRWSWTPPAGAKYSGRRRALANWLTDPERGAGHLLARVIVNRLWQHHFGQGLVATPNDFGVQGARPSHPELLDWLAGELIRGGWRLKPIHQLLLTSAVYQQDNTAPAAKVRADPANTLFARRPPQRLEAEAIRDSLLFVSGVLETNMYGPGTLDETNRRRSIYFTVKRSRLIPALQAFDAPEPLVSQGARPTTTVAPQALLLMNSAPVRSWAAAFAGRLASTPVASRDLPAAIDRAYQLAFNRSPNKQEAAEALAFISEQQLRHTAHDQDTPLHLALTDFAQVVLSLNEFIYAD